jgi:hypothetical protein
MIGDGGRTRAVRGLAGMKGAGEGGVVREVRTEEVREMVDGLLLLKAFFSFLVIDGLLPSPDDDEPSVPSRFSSPVVVVARQLLVAIQHRFEVWYRYLGRLG